MKLEARRLGGYWAWRASQGDVRVTFAGKGPRLGRESALRRLLPEDVEPAWLEQLHSADVLTARSGPSGPGDALVTAEKNRALTVVTADCVPLLLAGSRCLAAVHAGWRGVAGSIVAAVLARFEAGGEITAWIGPAIGPCCYEVGHAVAEKVAEAASQDVVSDGGRGRPHLDLVAAVRVQLERGGVSDVRVVDGCTRCDEGRLWSYRREGPGAGRNMAAIWRS